MKDIMEGLTRNAWILLRFYDEFRVSNDNQGATAYVYTKNNVIQYNI